MRVYMCRHLKVKVLHTCKTRSVDNLSNGSSTQSQFGTLTSHAQPRLTAVPAALLLHRHTGTRSCPRHLTKTCGAPLAGLGVLLPMPLMYSPSPVDEPILAVRCAAEEACPMLASSDDQVCPLRCNLREVMVRDALLKRDHRHNRLLKLPTAVLTWQAAAAGLACTLAPAQSLQPHQGCRIRNA